MRKFQRNSEKYFKEILRINSQKLSENFKEILTNMSEILRNISDKF